MNLRDGIANLLLILSTILSASVRRCEAQKASDPINLTALIASIVTTLVVLGIALLVVCIILCLTCNKWLVAREERRTRQMAATLAARSRSRQQQSQVAGNTNSRSNPQAEGHSNYSQPLPSASHPAATTTSSEANGTTSMQQCHVILEAEQPISLPEATLHQGEDPPAYAEAIEMKTVHLDDNIADQNTSSLQDRNSLD